MTNGEWSRRLSEPDDGLSRRSVLVRLSTGGLVTGLAGCTANPDERDRGTTNTSPDRTPSPDDGSDDQTTTDTATNDDDTIWLWADPSHDKSIDQSDVELAREFVNGETDPSEDQRRVTDLAEPCGKLTEADTRLIDGYQSTGCADLERGVECWPYKETLVPDQRTVDLQELTGGERTTATVTVSNEGDSELAAEFSLISESEMQLAGESRTKTLTAGESVELTVQVEPADSGLIAGTIIATVDGHFSWVTRVVGTVTPDLEALSTALEENYDDPGYDEVA